MQQPYKTRVLALDIETAPNLVYTWGLWNQNIGINQIKEPGRIICYSAMWEGSKTVIFQSEYHDGQDVMLAGLHTLMDEADLIIGWNSTSFDIPWIEGEFQLAGLLPPAPFHQLDLMKHFRRHSKLASKKLAYVSQRMLGDTKLTHSGFEMWRACIEPDFDPEAKRKAWNLMRRYAKKDTALLFPIFDSVKGWVKLPVPLVVDSGETLCRHGHSDIQWRGYSYSSASVWRRFQCQEPTCGAWGKSFVRHSSTGNARQA